MMNEDRISKLPLDILISIISRLNVKEATSTCILSTCWRHLHCYVTHLVFPAHDHVIDIQSNYLSMIDHVLNSHRGGRIKEFTLKKLSMDLNGMPAFESWFEFALSKKAEIIHMSIHFRDGEAFRLGNTNGLECLKELYLSHIELDDEDFELLVSNCVALECLTIELSFRLENISIVGLSKLKHLQLFCELTSVVIRDAINLISLTCYEWRSGCSVQLSNIPKLTNLDLRDFTTSLMQVEFLAGMPSCIRDQLQLLRLTSRPVGMYKRNFELLNDLSIQLVNIKHLQLELNLYDTKDYISIYIHRLVEVCGSLEKLVIKFLREPLWRLLEEEVMTEAYNHPERELSQKYLEISGYSGSELERELTLDLINNAITHQTVSVVARDEEALAQARLDFGHIKSVSFLVI